MKKVLASLDSVIYRLEDSGYFLEAEDLHNVFIKVAEIEKDAGLKDIGKAVIPALALMGNVGNVVNDYKSVDPIKNQQTMEEDGVEKSVGIGDKKIFKSDGSSGGGLSDRVKLFIAKFEYPEIDKILSSMGVTKKIKSQSDLNDPTVVMALENYYKNMNFGKLNPLLYPIEREISRLLINGKTSEQKIINSINKYWGLQNNSTKLDNNFMKELNMKLLAVNDPPKLSKFLNDLRSNFSSQPVVKKSLFPGV
jgi:hypothetical protein